MNCCSQILKALVLLAIQTGGVNESPTKIPPPSEADIREFEYLVMGMKSSREAVTSAIVTYKGRRTRVDKGDPSQNIDGKIEGLMAFDIPGNRLRIRHKMPESYGAPIRSNELQSALEEGELKKLAKGPYQQTDQYLMFVRNQSYAAHYARNGSVDSNLDIGAVDWSLASRRDLLRLIDLRSLGLIDVQDLNGWEPPLIYPGSITKIDDSSLLCPLETVLHNIKVRNYFRLIRKAGVATIEWGPHTLVIDEDRGFSPIEYRTTDLYWNLYKRRYVATTSWTKVSDHWLPSKAVLELDDEKYERKDRFELELEWSKINEELPDHLFNYESFEDVADETIVIDSRHEKFESGILGEWIDGKLQTAFDKEPEVQSSRLLMICILLLPPVLIFYLWRRSRRPLINAAAQPLIEE